MANSYEAAYDAFGGKEATDKLLAELRSMGISEDTINEALSPYFKTTPAAVATPAAVTTPAINKPETLADNQTFSDQITAGTPTTEDEFLSAISTTSGNQAPADNVVAPIYTKSSNRPTSGGVSTVVEGDDIDTQISQLPEEVAHWERSADQRTMELIDDKTGAVLERKAVGDFSDLDLLKTGLSFIPGAGQVLAAVNIADAVRTGDLTTAAIGATGLIPGLQNVNTALRVGQAVDQDNPFGAITALAGNTDLQNLTGLNTANVGGFTAKDAMAAANLTKSAIDGNAAGVLTNLGTLAGSSDTVLAGRALNLITRVQNGDTRALSDAISLSNSVSGGSTGTTGSTTVGNFEDNEVTRLKDLGYTNKQIQDYFNNLDNLTGALDEATTTGTTVSGLPTGVQLASLGDGVFKTDVGGVPTYAESSNASSVTTPFGYTLLSTSEADNKPAGSYYDPTANAWFKPDTAVTDLTGSANIQSDLDLFNSSLGDLDNLDTTRSADDFADFLKTIGITNVDQLTDSGLSNQDILDMINAADDTVTVTDKKDTDTVTGGTGTDTITGGTGNDNVDELVVTDKKDTDTVTNIDTITGGDGNDLVVDDKGNVTIVGTKESCPVGTVLNPETGECDAVEDKGEVVITDKKESCPVGTVLNPETGECDAVEDKGEVVITDKKESCPIGTVLNPETGNCDPIVETPAALDCPEGFEPNAEGTACIPVVTITDKKCDPGFVYDEDLKMCVPIKGEDECPTGFHKDADGKCVPDTKEELKCPEGYEPNEAGTECIPVVVIQDKKCPPGQVYDEDLKMCVTVKNEECPTGYHRDEVTGACVPDVEECPTGYHRDEATGQCVKDALVCAEGFELNEAGTECIPIIKITACPVGQHRDETGKCVPDTVECEVGYHLENGMCVKDKLECPEGYELNEAGTECIPIVKITECKEGYHRDEVTGQCVKDKLECPEGYELNDAGTECIPIIKIEECKEGFHKNAEGVCVPDTEECAEGFHLENGICVPDDDEKCKDGYEKVNGTCVPVCKEGYLRNLETGTCEKVEEKACPPGQVKDASGKCVPITKTTECQPGYERVNGVCVPMCQAGYLRINGVCQKIIPDTLATPTGGVSAEGERTDPIYATGMDAFDLFATLEELLNENSDKTDKKKDSKKSKEKTKMATGGHLDDLLAEQMTVDDLLKLLR